MKTPTFKPSFSTFEEMATRGNLIAVYMEVAADTITPITAFHRIGGEYSFLLESAERTGEIGRYSFIGSNPKLIFSSKGSTITITEGQHTHEFESKAEPLVELKKIMDRYRFVANPDLPHFCGGMVGYLGYDCVRFFSPKLKAAKENDLKVPESLFMLADQLVIFDQLTRRIKIVALAAIENGDVSRAYEQACRTILTLSLKIEGRESLSTLDSLADPVDFPIEANMSKEQFCDLVAQSKEFILSGDIFQIVLSQRFQIAYKGDPLHLYRTLWMVNPSPYMFCMRLGKDFSIVGSSPEVHVRLTGRRVQIRPIAGTRKRGKNPEEDLANEKELLADEKERAEHIMLVDLARNDVGRDAEYGSVKVPEIMQIERFSHVMHIVTSVEGTLLAERDMFDVMRSTFPAGTVSGSPKHRAMQIISDFEPCQRGVYSGAVGYFGFDGNMDSCIALRTVVVKKGVAYVQAGAGIVADSTPEGEYAECVQKATGMLRAIARANQT